MTSWLVQRISATYLGFYLLGFIIALLLQGGWSFDQWQSMMSSKIMIAATFLFYISLLIHAWVGIRDVVIDYIHPLPLRLFLLSIIAAMLMIFAFWSTRILSGIA